MVNNIKKHEWFLFRTSTRPNGLPCCRKCGIVRRADGKSDDKPCKGPVGVALRKSA